MYLSNILQNQITFPQGSLIVYSETPDIKEQWINIDNKWNVLLNVRGQHVVYTQQNDTPSYWTDTWRKQNCKKTTHVPLYIRIFKFPWIELIMNISGFRSMQSGTGIRRTVLLPMRTNQFGDDEIFMVLNSRWTHSKRTSGIILQPATLFRTSPVGGHLNDVELQSDDFIKCAIREGVEETGVDMSADIRRAKQFRMPWIDDTAWLSFVVSPEIEKSLTASTWVHHDLPKTARNVNSVDDFPEQYAGGWVSIDTLFIQAITNACLPIGPMLTIPTYLRRDISLFFHNLEHSCRLGESDILEYIHAGYSPVKK